MIVMTENAPFPQSLPTLETERLLRDVQAICTPANKRSLRVIEKAGLRYENLLRDSIWFEIGPLAMKIHAILRAEWLKNGNAN